MSREEQILTGQDAPTPVTRKEMYLSAIAGNTPVDDLPTPVTREEKFLNEAAQSGGGGGGGGSSDQLYTGGLEIGGINRSTGALDDTDINAVRTPDFIELEPGTYVLLWYYTNPAEMLYTWVEIYNESGTFVRSFDTYGATQPPFTFTLTEKSKVKFLWKRAYAAGYQLTTDLIPNIYLGLVPS